MRLLPGIAIAVDAHSRVCIPPLSDVDTCNHTRTHAEAGKQAKAQPYIILFLFLFLKKKNPKKITHTYIGGPRHDRRPNGPQHQHPRPARRLGRAPVRFSALYRTGGANGARRDPFPHATHPINPPTALHTKQLLAAPHPPHRPRRQGRRHRPRPQCARGASQFTAHFTSLPPKSASQIIRTSQSPRQSRIFPHAPPLPNPSQDTHNHHSGSSDAPPNPTHTHNHNRG